MTKFITSFVFTLLLLSALTVPTIIALMDDKSDDVMVYFDGSEEEESGNEESKSEQKIEFLKENLREFCLISIKSTIFMDDHICMYCSVFRQIYSPPPETIV